MARPKALVLFAPGTNCDEETRYCLDRAGATADKVFIGDLFEHKFAPDDYQILALPGGFSYGDCIAAGRILATYLATRLKDLLQEFVNRDKLVIGICNGFQVLAHLGFFNLPEGKITLERNESLKFECRWVRLTVPQNAASIFVKGITDIWLPVAHAEGRLMAESPAMLDTFTTEGRIALTYSSRSGNGNPVYPENPNGSQGNIAGLTDATGRVFGLMPHPERYFSSRYCFAAGPGRSAPKANGNLGLKVFENAVGYFA